MGEALTTLFRPSTLFDPIGTSFGDQAQWFIGFFGGVFIIGLLIRAYLSFKKDLNPFLQRFLQRLAFVIMFWGITAAAYFLIREQGVAYLTANSVFVAMTLIFMAWIVYLLGYKYAVVYRRQRAEYDAKKAREKYIPKKKKR